MTLHLNRNSTNIRLLYQACPEVPAPVFCSLANSTFCFPYCRVRSNAASRIWACRARVSLSVCVSWTVFFPLHECQSVLLWVGVPSATVLHLALGEGLFPGLQVIDIGRTVGDEALGNEELSENGPYKTGPEENREGEIPRLTTRFLSRQATVTLPTEGT